MRFVRSLRKRTIFEEDVRIETSEAVATVNDSATAASDHTYDRSQD